MRLSTAQRISAAFSLVEVALAMGVASFCLVAVLGLVPLGVSTNEAASDQATGSNILTHVLADLRATPMTSPPGGVTASAEYKLAFPLHGSGASTAPVVLPPIYFGNSVQHFSFSPTAAASRFRLTVSFLPSTANPPTGSVDRTASGVSLQVSWPPSVNPNDSSTGTPTGHVQIFANLDRN